MASAKTAKTVSLDVELLQQIERTKGRASTSERVNQLLRSGLEAEQQRLLYQEAAEFFSDNDDRPERRAYQTATLRSLSRE